MQKAGSGLAAAAARMQLTDAPEGKSSLQSRLSEAERRAQDAEASAQDARAALARTLLEAAQVEAVVTARVKAQREAEICALRTELNAAKSTGPRDGDVPAAPTPPETVRVPDPVKTDAESLPDMPALDPAQAGLLRMLPPMRLAFLSVTAVVAVVSYLVASSHFGNDGGKLSVAMKAVSGIAGFAADDDRLVRGAATDSAAIADASATLDAELERLQSLSKRVAAMRAFVATQTASRTSEGSLPAVAQSRTGAAIGAGSGPRGNWLLYMPVERDALVQYLAGRKWPGMQVAVQEKPIPEATPAARKN